MQPLGEISEHRHFDASLLARGHRHRSLLEERRHARPRTFRRRTVGAALRCAPSIVVMEQTRAMTSNPPQTRSKVVFVNRYFFPDQSASSQMLSDLSFGLAQRGFSIHVICSRQLYDNARAALPPLEAIDGVTVHRGWTTRFGRDRLVGRALDYISFYLSSAWILAKILKRGDTAVAKTDPPLISIVAMAAAKAKGAHLVNWLQDIFPEVASRLGNNPLP